MFSSPRRDRRPRRAWSLRARLLAALLGLFAVVALGIGAVTDVALYRTLLARLDDRIHNVAGPPPNAPGAGNRSIQDLPGTVRLRVEDGAPIEAIYTNDAGPTALSSQAITTLRAVPLDNHGHTVSLAGLGTFRVAARTDRDGSGLIVAGLPMSEVYTPLTWVALAEGGVTAGGLVLAWVAGAVIVRRTLRPLDRVAATAGRVAELRLDRGEVALAERVLPADTDPRTEVGKVGSALNRMLDHVGDALEARHASETQVRQFVADASHELRTPLAAIRGYAELTRRAPEGVPQELAHVLRRVESEAQRMTLLVEDMLLLARLDAGRPLQHRPVDLSALVVDAVSDAHAAGPQHVWTLDLPEDEIQVVGDQARLHQVLANLLANARAHTPPGTKVTVSLATESETAVVRVTDEGPGIPAELLPHVFERFARGDTSRSRAAGSTGLGLAIVGAVVAAHGGTVEVASRPGRTEFSVRLPRA